MFEFDSPSNRNGPVTIILSVMNVESVACRNELITKKCIPACRNVLGTSITKKLPRKAHATMFN